MTIRGVRAKSTLSDVRAKFAKLLPCRGTPNSFSSVRSMAKIGTLAVLLDPVGVCAMQFETLEASPYIVAILVCLVLVFVFFKRCTDQYVGSGEIRRISTQYVSDEEESDSD